MMWFNLLSGGIAIHVFFSTFFPKEYYGFLLNASFYVIMFYSYSEICINKIYTHPYFAQLKDYLDTMTPKNEIEIIKFNNTIMSTNKNAVCINQLVLCDFIIYSDYISSSKINKILYYGLVQFPINFSYSICEFTFLAVNVRLNKIGKPQTYQINLRDNYFNYYIVGNKINRLLICYLLKVQHGIVCDELTDSYELEIIDNNVTLRNFTENDEIIFYETDYKVLPFIYCDTSNMSVKEIKEKCNYKDFLEISNIGENKFEESREHVDSIPE